MNKEEKRIREKTLKKLMGKLWSKYYKFLRVQVPKETDNKKFDKKINGEEQKKKVSQEKTELNRLIKQVVQIYVALSDKYFEWFKNEEQKEEITADSIFLFFTTVNHQSEPTRFAKKWDEKIWPEIKSSKKIIKKAKKMFNEEHVCILHLVMCYLIDHQTIKV